MISEMKVPFKGLMQVSSKEFLCHCWLDGMTTGPNADLFPGFSMLLFLLLVTLSVERRSDLVES